MKIALFITCLTDNYSPRSGIAVVKVLEHLGHDVCFPESQTCCGQPMFNNGFSSEARDLARRMIRVFEPYETVVTPSGSCAAMIREHFPSLFEDDQEFKKKAESLAGRTHEFVEFLTKVEKVDLRCLGVKRDEKVTYHYSCHLRGLGQTDEAEQLIRQIDGLDYLPLSKKEQCCGFGGTFAVKYSPISGQMVLDKVASIRETGADTVIVNDAGCAMNMAGACRRGGCDVGFISLAETIAEGLGLMAPERSP